jgi:hypothetical protein
VARKLGHASHESRRRFRDHGRACPPRKLGPTLFISLRGESDYALVACGGHAIEGQFSKIEQLRSPRPRHRRLHPPPPPPLAPRHTPPGATYVAGPAGNATGGAGAKGTAEGPFRGPRPLGFFGGTRILAILLSLPTLRSLLRLIEFLKNSDHTKKQTGLRLSFILFHNARNDWWTPVH